MPMWPPNFLIQFLLQRNKSKKRATINYKQTKAITLWPIPGTGKGVALEVLNTLNRYSWAVPNPVSDKTQQNGEKHQELKDSRNKSMKTPKPEPAKNKKNKMATSNR